MLKAGPKPPAPKRQPPPLPISIRIRQDERIRIIALIQDINKQITIENSEEFSILMRKTILEDAGLMLIFKQYPFTISGENLRQLENALRYQKTYLEELVNHSSLRLQNAPFLRDKEDKEIVYFKQLKASNEKTLERFINRMIYIYQTLKIISAPIKVAPSSPPNEEEVSIADLFAASSLTPLRDSKQEEQKFHVQDPEMPKGLPPDIPQTPAAASLRQEKPKPWQVHFKLGGK